MIEIRQVSNPRERRIFLTLPWKIYRDDPLWVPPLISEMRKRIDPKEGAFFQRGIAEFFIAWRDGKAVGRICAAQDFKANQHRDRQECIFGFFECINDYDVARALLDHAAAWARQHNLAVLFGPFNLDNEDSYGILLEGRDRPPVMLCGHTPAYYLDFIERYGFQPGRATNIAYALDLRGQPSPELQKLSRAAHRLEDQNRFVVRNADFAHWQEEVNHVFILINRALAHLDDHSPWQREALESLLLPFKDIASPDLILFVEDREKDQVVGFLPGIPNLNEVFIHTNGLRLPWDYLKLFRYMRRQTKCLTIKSVLVLPEYWGTGASLLLFHEMEKRARAKGYEWLDLSLTSEDNPKTPILAERMGAKVYKRYQVYRKWL